MVATLAEEFAARATRYGAATALIGPGGEVLSYQRLHERGCQVARALAAADVGAGDRVGWLDRNDPAFFEVALGCSHLGAVIVGLNWRLAARELASIADDAELALVIAAADLLDLLPADLREGDRLVVSGTAYEDWIGGHDARPPAGSAAGAVAGVAADPSQPVYQLYSSGTTGVPKGALITSANLSWTLRAGAELYGMDASSTNLLVSPLFHIGGAGYGLTALGQGGRTVVARDLTPAALLRAIEDHAVTHAFLVPALVQALVEAPEVGSTDLSSLRLIAYGGAPMGEGLLRKAIEVLGCEFAGVYGMTETSGTVVALRPADHDPGGPRARLLRSIGLPLPWVEVRVVDPATGDEAQSGAVGELWVRSAAVVPGYWRQPEATADALVDGGWLRTGDAVFRDDEGFLFLHDRMKDMIISGGENIYPAEVENVLSDHPAVSEVAVIGVPSTRWGETVKALVVPRSGTTLDPDDIIAFCRERLAHYKCPTSVDTVTELPRNASGKLLKKILRAPYWADAGDPDDADDPATT